MQSATIIKHPNKGRRKRVRILRRIRNTIMSLMLLVVFAPLVHGITKDVLALITKDDSLLASTITAVDTYEQVEAEVEEAVASTTHISAEHSVTFRIAGDFMFARGVHKKFNKNPSLSLDKIGGDFFDGTDASIVNLEGAISTTQWQEIVKSGSFKFVFPSTVIDVLKAYNINAVSLANNHSLNNGWGGLTDTKKLLTDNSIQHFGGPTNANTAEVSIIKGTNLNLVLIGVHTLYETPDIDWLIKKYKKDELNKVLVMPHWGVEYSFKHNKKQEELAHSWADAGADLIVGAHPHVVQDTEVYNGVPIIYSLGNFLFDQTEQNTGEKGVQDGMTLHGKFIKDKLALYAVPIELRDFQPRLVKDKEKANKILDDFYKPWKNNIQVINGANLFVFE